MREPWAVFDVVVIALALAPLPANASVLRLARLGRLARVAHLGRHGVSHLRLLPFVRSDRVVLIGGAARAVGGVRRCRAVGNK
jgi:hypothetical protein